GGGHRPDHRRHVDPGLRLPEHGLPAAGQARRQGQRRLRRAGGLQRLRLRARHRRRLHQERRPQEGAGRRGGSVLAHPRLERPRHLRAVRRWLRRRGAERCREAGHPRQRAARRRQPCRHAFGARQRVRRRDRRLAVPADERAGGVQVRGQGAGSVDARDRGRRRHEALRHRLADSAPGERAHPRRHRAQARPAERKAGGDGRPSRQYFGRLGAARARRVRARRQDQARPAPAAAGRGRRLHLGLERGDAMKLAMVFPGQGSQSVGMLNAYDGLPEIMDVRTQAAQVLGPEFDRVLNEGPEDALKLTVNTQPAMVTAGYAVYRAWRALGGPVPEIVAGHSLGEYTALVAAGAIDFKDCLPLVRFRAQSMQEAVPEGQGAMAAILMLDDDAVRAACTEAGGTVQAVNFNAPGQVVIAGEKAAVERAMEACKTKGAKRAMLLPVSAPFHSTLMKPAAAKLATYLAKLAMQSPKISVLNNVDVAVETSPERIKHALVRQAASPVRWVETIKKMADAGVTHIVECGPGKVLAGMTKRIAPGVKSFAAADRASLQEALKC